MLVNVILCIIVSNYSDTKNAEKQLQILDESRRLTTHSTGGDLDDPKEEIVPSIKDELKKSFE